jgi:hypothetical protein
MIAGTMGRRAAIMKAKNWREARCKSRFDWGSFFPPLHRA